MTGNGGCVAGSGRAWHVVEGRGRVSRRESR